MLDPGGRDGNERLALRTSPPADQTEFVGLFPHGQARARGSPCFDRLTVRSGIGTDPLQEVQDQAVNVVDQELLYAHGRCFVPGPRRLHPTIGGALTTTGLRRRDSCVGAAEVDPVKQRP